MNYTPEELIKFAEYLGYKEIDTTSRLNSYYFIMDKTLYIQTDITKTPFDPTDFNIIKALEQKMCEELGVKYVERYRIQGVLHVIYWDSQYENRLMIKGGSKELDNLEAEKECILNAVEQHINKGKK